MERIKNWIEGYWVQHLIVCLGLFGLGNAWAVLGYDQLLYVAAALYLLTVGMVVARAVLNTANFVADWQNTGNLVAYIGGAGASYFFAKFIATYSLRAAILIWCAALTVNLFGTVSFTRLLFKGGFSWNKIIPPCFLIYCGFGMSAIVGPSLGLQWLTKYIAVYAVSMCIVLLFAITYRIVTLGLPEALLPSLAIYEAAPSMTMVAWISNFGTWGMAMPIILAITGQLMFVMLLTKMPKFYALEFGPGFAALTFPFAIGAQAVYRLGENFFSGMALEITHLLFGAELCFASGIISLIVLGFTSENIKKLLSRPQPQSVQLCDTELFFEMLDTRVTDLCSIKYADAVLESCFEIEYQLNAA